MKAVRLACNKPQGRIKLHAPQITELERELARDCIDLGLVGYEYVERFETMLARECRVKHAVAMSSGTAALDVALRCVSNWAWPEGERVACPSLTFQAAAAAISHAAAEPVFLDSAWNLTVADLPARCGDTLIATDLLGERADHGSLSDAFAGALVEDAAESIGQINGIRGNAAIVSFNNNKLVTTNGGGALLTDDVGIAKEARHRSTTARRPHPTLVEPDDVGWNYRMGNINAAIGCAQLERLDEMKASKRRLADRYTVEFYGVEGAHFIEHPWLNVVMVEPQDRDPVLETLQADGIEARCLFTPLHLTPPYKTEQDLPRCVETWRRCICLPSGPGLA